jgi:hypothetical protein
MRRGLKRAGAVLVAALALAACTSQGPDKLPIRPTPSAHLENALTQANCLSKGNFNAYLWRNGDGTWTPATLFEYLKNGTRSVYSSSNVVKLEVQGNTFVWSVQLAPGASGVVFCSPQLVRGQVGKKPVVVEYPDLKPGQMSLTPGPGPEVVRFGLVGYDPSRPDGNGNIRDAYPHS